MEWINAKTIGGRAIDLQVNYTGINPGGSQSGTGDLDNLIGANPHFLDCDRNCGGREKPNSHKTENRNPGFPRDKCP
jgi:hypothetical protein